MAIGTPVYLGNTSATTSGTTIGLTTTAAITAGDIVIVGIERDSVDRTLDSVTDSSGNTYTIDATMNSSGRGVWIASSANAAAMASGNVITAQFSGGTSTTRRAMSAISVSGVATTSALDKASSGATGSSTAWSTGASGTLSQADEIAVGWGVAVSTGTFTPTSGWSGWSTGGASFLTGGGRAPHVYQIVSATTSLTASGTVGNNTWYGILATYKGAAADTTVSVTTAAATAAGGTVAVTFDATVAVTEGAATASGGDVTITTDGGDTTVAVTTAAATAAGGTVAVTYDVTVAVTTGAATADGGTVIVDIGDGSATIAVTSAAATAGGGTVTPTFLGRVAVTRASATASGQATPTIIGPPVGGGSGEGTGLLNAPGQFRIKLTSLHYPENTVTHAAARPAATIAMLHQYTDAEVDIPANNARTARVTISMHDPAYEFVEAYEHMVHVVYVTASTTWVVFWGVITNVSDSSEQGTVTLSCVDRSLGLTRQFLRFGDQALNESDDTVLPNVHGKGNVPLDAVGLRMLRDAGINTEEQTARGVPDLGIIDGTDNTDALPSITDLVMGVKRGEQVWQRMLDLVSHYPAPDFELEPIDTTAGVYAQLNTYVRQGNSDPDDLLLHDGWGRDNCRIDRNSGGAVTTHVHVLSTGDQKRITVADSASSALLGAYVDWESTDYAADDTSPLTERGLELIDRRGSPPDYFTVRLNDSSGLFYMEDFTVGAACRAVRRRGTRPFSAEGHITRVTLRQRDTAGNVTPLIECAVVGGTGGAGEDTDF